MYCLEKGQRDAIIHNIFIHTGIDRDIDEHDIVSTSKVDLKTKSVLIVFMPFYSKHKYKCQSCKFEFN